jgi:hypothetical protein
VTIDEPKPPANPVELPCFFQKVDWLSFGLTTLVALTVYLLTLAPDVTLEYSGVYSTAALYPGSSIPPGHPLWTVYGCLFIKLIPFSNIAWRLGVASAMAGALTCGLIALMVSRVGFSAVEKIPGFNKISAREQKSFRLVCGGVAGLGFGFDGCFWRKAVVADTWPLSLFLFALTICLLTRWFFAQQQTRFLYAAAFVHGLTLSESQALIPATFALPFLLALSDRKLGREMFFGISVCLWAVLLMNNSLEQFGWYIGEPSRKMLAGTAATATFAWAGLSLLTRGFFSEWKTTSVCAVLFLTGISAYLLLPILSMTNPPINWGYPRTVEGFFHVLSRGQFESINPTNSFNQLMTQWKIYGKIAAEDCGMVYLIAATIPFVLQHKVSPLARRWLVGLLGVWFLLGLLMLVGLNLPNDRSAIEADRPFFAATHLLLALLAGCGLMLIGAFCARPAPEKSEC